MNTISPALATQPGATARRGRPTRLSLLSTSFACFNALRIVGYLPTLLAIQSSGHADQHSLFTWIVFVGANTTMALWLHEHNGHRVDRAVAVNAFNALMCAGIAASIAWIRWMSF